jgi:hypothetical protein
MEPSFLYSLRIVDAGLAEIDCKSGDDHEIRHDSTIPECPHPISRRRHYRNPARQPARMRVLAHGAVLRPSSGNLRGADRQMVDPDHSWSARILIASAAHAAAFLRLAATL